MNQDEINAMSTEEAFDYLRLHTDHTLAPLIDHLEQRWLLASSAAKLWFKHASGDIKAERERLDRQAVEAEHRLG